MSTSPRQDAGASVSCYLNEIPAFVGPELARVYGTLHSSLPFFELFRSTERTNCYVTWRDGRAAEIILFAVRGKRVEVLNEMIEIGADELQRFARHVFAAFPEAGVIRFRALKMAPGSVGFPFQRHASKYTYRIALPEAPEAYLGTLGRETRNGIKRKIAKLAKHCVSWHMEFREGDTIDEDELLRIMRMSEANINAGQVKLRYDTARITAMAKRCGLVSMLVIDGQCCAGAISYRIGANYFSELLGFDRRYENFGIGTVCEYHTICEMIARGGKGFYLGGGHFAYKQRLGAAIVHMDELNIYRSRRTLLANPGYAAGRILASAFVRGKEFLHRHRDNVLAKLVFGGFYFLRSRSLK